MNGELCTGRLLLMLVLVIEKEGMRIKATVALEIVEGESLCIVMGCGVFGVIYLRFWGIGLIGEGEEALEILGSACKEFLMCILGICLVM